MRSGVGCASCAPGTEAVRSRARTQARTRALLDFCRPSSSSVYHQRRPFGQDAASLSVVWRDLHCSGERGGSRREPVRKPTENGESLMLPSSQDSGVS